MTATKPKGKMKNRTITKKKNRQKNPQRDSLLVQRIKSLLFKVS